MYLSRIVELEETVPVIKKKFDGEFLAICKQKVVDHDEELSDLMERIREKYPGGNVFVDFVSSEKLMLIL